MTAGLIYENRRENGIYRAIARAVGQARRLPPLFRALSGRVMAFRSLPDDGRNSRSRVVYGPSSLVRRCRFSFRGPPLVLSLRLRCFPVRNHGADQGTLPLSPLIDDRHASAAGDANIRSIRLLPRSLSSSLSPSCGLQSFVQFPRFL